MSDDKGRKDSGAPAPSPCRICTTTGGSTMSDDTQANQLRTIPATFGDPPPGLISKLPKGRKDSSAPSPSPCRICDGYHPSNWVHLDFVGHADITLMLIAIDPLWSWEPCAVDEEYGGPKIRERNGTLSMWGRLTVCGKTILGVGTCEIKDDAEKELIGDFLRNAAMRFGFCTKLWSKSDALPSLPPPAATPENNGKSAGKTLKIEMTPAIEAPATQPTGAAAFGGALASPAQIKALNTAICDLGIKDRDDKLRWISDRVGRIVESSRSLTASEAHSCISASAAGEVSPEPGSNG